MKIIENFRADEYGNLKMDNNISPAEKKRLRLKELAKTIEDDDTEVGKFLISFFDMFLNGILEMLNNLIYESVKFGTDVMKRDDDNEKNIYKKGALYDLIYVRYIITILLPPLGVFLSKGMFGWMNMLMCIFFCYLNYLVGIIYALVITYNSHFPDLYMNAQKEKINKIKKELKERQEIDLDQQKGEMFVMLLFLFIFIGIFISIIFFNKKIIKK